MNEALRLAYLEAMGIPVWVPRVPGETPAVIAEVTLFTGMDAERAGPRNLPAQQRRSSAAGRLVDELLGDGGVPGAAASPVMQRKIPAARDAAAATAVVAAGTVVPTLLLVTAGRYLFIDEAGDPRRDARVGALAAAIAFALDGERPAASMQRFDPVASGLAPDRARARDLLLGLLTKLTETTDFAHLIVLGATAATALLGWDGQTYLQRRPQVHAVDGLRIGALVTLAADTLLEDSALKAAAWSELSAARGRHDS